MPSQPEPEPFLILHKVRGQPAYDVATMIGQDSAGPIWIIPTSGHRAWPCWETPLRVLLADMNTIIQVPRTEDQLNYMDWLAETMVLPELADHYAASAPRRPKAVQAVSESLENILDSMTPEEIAVLEASLNQEPAPVEDAYQHQVGPDLAGAVARIAEIDDMFEQATGWGSWMVEASNERAALADKYCLPHKHRTNAS